jgi:hypothetical protein
MTDNNGMSIFSDEYETDKTEILGNSENIDLLKETETITIDYESYSISKPKRIIIKAIIQND